MTCVEIILRKIPGTSKWQRDFIASLLTLILALPGRMTFRNMSRYSNRHERTFARHFAKGFDWVSFNQALLEPVFDAPMLIVTDCSFLPKSGKKTYGLDLFWNGSAARNERGLELSVIALIDRQRRDAYTVSALQTPPPTDLERPESLVEGRTVFYLRQLEQVAPYLPEKARYVAADGYYAKKTYLDGVSELGLHLISKLRCDANLRYLYRGPHEKRPGRRRQYEGKVDLNDVSRLDYLGEIEPGIELYTEVVNSPHFKRNLRLAYLLDRRKPGKVRYAVLFSTDTDLDARELVRLYRLRFQVEFIFRDAKQYTGLSDCQARSQARLAFHFNASLAALNVARLAARSGSSPAVFSMASVKRRGYNRLFLDRIIRYLDLEAEVVLMHPAYEGLCTYGAIAA
jgi:hypothetical protein